MLAQVHLPPAQHRVRLRPPGSCASNSLGATPCLGLARALLVMAPPCRGHRELLTHAHTQRGLRASPRHACACCALSLQGEVCHFNRACPAQARSSPRCLSDGVGRKALPGRVQGAGHLACTFGHGAGALASCGCASRFFAGALTPEQRACSSSMHTCNHGLRSCLQPWRAH